MTPVTHFLDRMQDMTFAVCDLSTGSCGHSVWNRMGKSEHFMPIFIQGNSSKFNKNWIGFASVILYPISSLLDFMHAVLWKFLYSVEVVTVIIGENVNSITMTILNVWSIEDHYVWIVSEQDKCSVVIDGLMNINRWQYDLSVYINVGCYDYTRHQFRRNQVVFSTWLA